MSTLKLLVNNGIMKVRKYAPEILLGTGIVSGVGSTVLACRATLKLDEKIKPHVKDLNRIKEAENVLTNYPEEEVKHDKIVVYTRLATDVVKLYGPAALLGIGSMACLICGNRIQGARIASLTAAYAALDQSFQEYKNRVLEGSERSELVADAVKRAGDESDGKNDVDAEIDAYLKSMRANLGASPYSRVFDAGSSGSWSSDPNINRIFLRHQENYLNDLLHSRGHLFLNEVYDALGFKRSKAGAVVGWVAKGGEGDGFVEFDIVDPNSLDASTGDGRYGFFVDFNVDGVIYDKI